MGSKPIPQLVIGMALPTIFAMIIQALYNVVDGIFVARISETDKSGFTAVSLAFPVQLVVVAVFVGLGVGLNALISRRLGERNPDGAVLVAENGIMITGIVYAIIAILGVVLAKPFVSLFSDNEAVIQQGTTYIRIIMLFSFGRIFASTGINILRGTGEMVIPMIAMLIGAVMNILLDPIMIFGYFGLPAMGVKGAALATIIAQILSMLFVWGKLLLGDNLIKLDLKHFKPQREVIRQILIIGIPVSIMQGIGSIMLIGFNLILARFGAVAIDVMGGYFRLQSLVFMPVFGLATGTMPIIGFNFGARNKQRMSEAIRFSTVVAVAFMSLCFLVFQLFPEMLLSIYDPGPEMLAAGIPAFRAISLVFPLIGATILLNTAFQALGQAHFSLITSVVRQLAVLLPAAWLLSLSGDLNNVWYAFIIAEVVGLILVVAIFRKVYHQSTAGWGV